MFLRTGRILMQVTKQDTHVLAQMRLRDIIYIEVIWLQDDGDGSDPAIPTGRNHCLHSQSKQVLTYRA